MSSPSLRLLRRLLLASGASCLAACGGRADLSELSYQAVADDDPAPQGGASGQGGGNQAGSGGSAAGKGGSSQAGAGGSAAGSGGSAAGSGGGALCDTSQEFPRDDDGNLECKEANQPGFAFCEIRCYVPGPQTLPGACREPEDPALAKVPGFEPQNCGFTKATRGPFCNAEAEKIAGNSPACCYVGTSEPCAGRPLLVAGRLRLASLQGAAWG